MKIVANQLAKRFDREWIFRNFSHEFNPTTTYALVGPNGSGKSTLMQLLWGQMVPTTGSLEFLIDEKKIDITEVYKHISIATPYMDLIDDFTAEEIVKFHFRFKSSRQPLSSLEILDWMRLAHAKNKIIRDFSSGMRQRLKLGLAFMTLSQAVFLDEPTTNLDKEAIKWYWENLQQLPNDCLVLIASNQEEEYPSTAQKIDILQYKEGYKLV
jgi:ABC-type multidrug transport system ATPase subunit